MDSEYVLAQICKMLYKMGEMDPRLNTKLSDHAIQQYVKFCLKDPNQFVCPVCFLALGRISYLLRPDPAVFATEQHLLCPYCTSTIPIETQPEKMAEL